MGKNKEANSNKTPKFVQYSMSVGRKLVVRLTHSKLHHLPSQATVQCQQGIFFKDLSFFFYLMLRNI